MTSEAISYERSTENSLPRPRWRWFRFSLRTMMIFVTAFALLLGLWIIPSERQYRTALQIEVESGTLNDFPRPTNRLTHYLHAVDRVKLILHPGNVHTEIDWNGLPRLKQLELHADWGLMWKLSTRGWKNDPKEKRFQFATKMLQYPRLSRSLNTLVLELPDQDVDDEVAKAIGHFPDLEILQIKYSSITDVGLQEIKKCRRLKELLIGGGEKSHGDLQAICEMAELEKLSLLFKIESKNVRFQNLRKLKYLSLTHVDLPDELLKNIAEIPALKQLTIASNARELSGSGGEIIARMPKIESLELYCKKFSTEGIKALAKMNQLRELVLIGHFEYSDLAYLTELPHLKILSLPSPTTENRLTDEIVKQLLKFPHLKILELNNSQITDAGLERLTELKDLEQLNMAYAPVSLPGLQSLAKLKKLKVLRLSQYYSPFTSAEIQQLRNRLPTVEITDKY